MKKSHIVVWLLLAGFIVHLATREPRHSTPSLQGDDRQFRLKELAKSKVRPHLRDAESARWGEIFEGKTGVLCGSVNAKNAFGAYPGFTRFVASGGDLVVFESELGANQFADVWSSTCR